MNASYIWFLPAFAKKVQNYLIWTHRLKKNYGVFRKDFMLSSGGTLFLFTPSKCVFCPREEHILMRQYIITLTTHELPALFPWLIFTSNSDGCPLPSHEESAMFSCWREESGNTIRSKWFHDLRSRCDQLALGPTFQSCLAAHTVVISNSPLNAHGKNCADVLSAAQAACRFQAGDGSVFVHQ